MKIIFFLFVTALLAFSSEKKIILGTYTHPQYASKALAKAKNLIDKDAALKIFMDLNHLNIQIEKIDAYNVVSIKSFTNNKELFYVLSKFEKNYADVYVLPPYKGSVKQKKHLPKQTPLPKQAQIAKKEVPIKVQKVLTKVKETLQHEETKPIVTHKPKPVQKVEKKVKVEKKEVEKEVAVHIPEPAYNELSTSTETLQDDAALEKEINDSYDTTSLFNYQIAITIIIAIILLMILFNTLMKLRQSSKKKNNDMM